MDEQNQLPDLLAPALIDRILMAVDAAGLIAAVLMLCFWASGENFRFLVAAILTFGEGIFECTCRRTVWGWEQTDPLQKPDRKFLRKRRIIVVIGILLGCVAMALTLAQKFNWMGN